MSEFSTTEALPTCLPERQGTRPALLLH